MRLGRLMGRESKYEVGRLVGRESKHEVGQAGG